MNLMRKIGYVLIVASCVAQSVAAMQKNIPFCDQIKEQAVAELQPAPAAAAQHQQGQVAPQNNNQNLDVLKKAQQELDEVLRMFPAKQPQGASAAAQAITPDASIVTAFKQIPKFLYEQKLVALATLTAAAALAFLVAYYDPIQWGTSKGVTYAKNIGICGLLPCFGYLGYEIFKLMKAYPRRAVGILWLILAGVSFMRYRELISDEIFASCAIPSAGIASLLYFFKIRNAQPEKKVPKEKSESAEKKPEQFKK
jgi:hypothetical protein